MEYTEYQRAAVDSVDDNLQIVACAGSGKTQVISARIVNILKNKKESGITPANIVAFTETEPISQPMSEKEVRDKTNEFRTMLGSARAACFSLITL